MRNLAIIPARSGSKGLKNKNIKDLNGKPLIAYTIEAALKTKIFDEVMVSTDSEEYSNIAKDYGASVPFLREKEYSSDIASSWDVVKSVLKKYELMGMDFDNVVLLQPTSPLRTKEDILRAFEIREEKNAKVIISVCEVDHSPVLANTIPEDGSLKGFLGSKYIDIPRQEIETYYRINGAIYLCDVKYLLNEKNLYGSETFALLMEEYNSIDIDKEIDFILASIILNEKLVEL